MSDRAGAQVLIDTQFGKSLDRVRIDRADAADRITGTLDLAWNDNSAWGDVTVDYSNQIEEGRPFTRVDVKRIGAGRVQVAHTLPGNPEQAFYLLSLMARSIDSSPIDVGVRQSGTPYEFLWQRRVSLTGGFQMIDFAFEVPATPDPISFFIYHISPGRVDVASVRLERVTREQLAGRMKEKGAVAGVNLLRVTRFPMGLPTGWGFNREASEDVVSVTALNDRAVEGGSAMRVVSLEPFHLHSAPINIVNPFEKHVVSIYARGQGEFDFRVRSDNPVQADERVNLTEQWQRVELNFEPRIGARWPVLEIAGTGTVDLDAMQCEMVQEGQHRAGPYKTANLAELTLGSPNLTRVWNPQARIPLWFAVTGTGVDYRTNQISYRVFDSANSEVMKETIDLKLKNQKDELTLGSPARDGSDWPIGSYRVEAQLFQGDKPVSNVDEVVFHVVRRPRFEGRDAPESYFGVHVEASVRSIKLAKAIGVNWVRLHDAGQKYTGWMYAEPQPGEWTFFDRELDRYRANHLMILGTLSTAPNWASYFDKPRNSYFDQFYRPRDMKQFENYVRTMVTRHKGRIQYWDVWNEPWITSWWSVGYDDTKPDRQGYLTSKEPQKDYVAMCRIVNDTAKSIDPRAVVMALNSTSNDPGSETMMSGRDWTRGIVASGGTEFADVLTFHMYSDGSQLYPVDSVERGIKVATDALPESAKSKPLWMTEGNVVHFSIGQGLYRLTVPGQEGENVRYIGDQLTRYVVSNLVHGVDKIFLYSMHSANGFGFKAEWKTFVCDDGSLHPSAVAFSQVAYRLDQAKFVRLIEAQSSFVYEFQLENETVAVVAPKPGQIPEVPVRTKVTIEDLLGNPVGPVLRRGEVFYVIGKQDAVNLAVKAIK